MSFMNGLSQAIGIRFGMAAMNKEETRPILRKRLLANVFYLGSILYCLLGSFSFRPQAPSYHVFWGWLDRNQWFALLMQKFGVVAYSPRTFTYLALFVVVVTTTVAVLLNKKNGESIWDLSDSWYLVVTFVCALFMYALIYDIAYFWFGNKCVPYLNVFCFNFANYAGDFAFWAAAVYAFRSSFLLRPSEKGTVAFDGNGILDLIGGGLIILPTLPAPHTICIIFYFAYDMIPVMWDLYHHPDGRERAVQNLIRRL